MRQKINIENIPAVIWGKESDKVFIAVHGNMSNKEDTVIKILADEAALKGYQTISFDLPEHGERKSDGVPCKVQYCVKDLRKIIEYAKTRWSKLSLFACSMGAYFSLLEYKDEKLDQALFLSPITDMFRLISNMFMWFNVTEEQLEASKEIQTPIGQMLYWDYYCYVKENPIDKWSCKTSILYGLNDNLSEKDTIDKFAERFNCDLRVLESGEHFFHTPEQLEVFTKWLKDKVK